MALSEIKIHLELSDESKEMFSQLLMQIETIKEQLKSFREGLAQTGTAVSTSDDAKGSNS